MSKLKYFCFFSIILPFVVMAQNDTIQFKNKQVLIGEIKSFSKGVLVMETSYSDKDFKIEFNKIESIVIQRKCLILLTKGRRRFGNFKTDKNGMGVITLEDNSKEYFQLEEIIALDEIDDNFWKRISGSIDFSFSLSKANSLTQFNIGGDLDYVDESWMIEGSVNLLNSYQDNVDRTKRTEATLEIYRILPRKWYLIGDFSFLANTEQALEGRIKPSIGVGKFLVSTNKLYLGLSFGYAYNIENYIDSFFNKTTSESFIKASFNMFDFENIDLESSVNISPSLSEKGRIRTDYDLNLKYDLPLDLYIKLGFILNYDNQPASGGNDVDYVFTTGFGWEFN
jgi:putative salt-induced outer membrane protein YdiY